MANRLITGRDFYVTELTAIKDTLSDTTELEKEKRMLDEQLKVDAKAVNDLIARNARVAQSQKEYQEKYDALVSRYEETKAKSESIAERIRQKSMRRRKLERFIDGVRNLPELITKFDAAQWAALVDTMTVYSNERIVFKLTSGMEIEI